VISGTLEIFRSIPARPAFPQQADALPAIAPRSPPRGANQLACVRKPPSFSAKAAALGLAGGREAAEDQGVGPILRA